LTPDEFRLYERLMAANQADASCDEAAHPGYMAAMLIAAALPRCRNALMEGAGGQREAAGASNPESLRPSGRCRDGKAPSSDTNEDRG